METADERRYICGFIKNLKERKKRNELTYQQYATLKGQALSGDLQGAEKGLKKIMQRIERVG